MRGGAGGDAGRERHGDRRPRPADGDARAQGAAVPASAAVAVRADDGHHHGAFACRPAALARGVRLATVPQVRGLPMSQDPKLNSHSKLNCVLACIQAEKAGADEALMLDPHGFVNTTNACNFFIVRKGEVWTSTGDYCMNGITRAQGHRAVPGERHPDPRAELLAGRDLRRRGGVPDRHLRRADAGGASSTAGATATALPGR